MLVLGYYESMYRKLGSKKIISAKYHVNLYSSKDLGYEFSCQFIYGQ